MDSFENQKDILFYSNHCDNCKRLLQQIAVTKYQFALHFVCIDSRVQSKEGHIEIIISSDTRIPLPSNIKNVPSLFLPYNGANVIQGTDEIMNYLAQSKKADIISKTKPNQNKEPTAANSGTSSTFSNKSNYVMFSESTRPLANAPDSVANRQQQDNVSYFDAMDNMSSIETIRKTYRHDKIGDGVSIDKLQQERNADINKIRPPQHKQFF